MPNILFTATPIQSCDLIVFGSRENKRSVQALFFIDSVSEFIDNEEMFCEHMSLSPEII